MAFGIRATDGSVGAPTLSFANDADCGFYRIGANNIGMAVGGAKVLDVSATGFAITGTASASGLITATSGVTVSGGTEATGRISAGPTNGLTLVGKSGSAYDISLLNAAGNAYALRVPTGTNNVELPGTVAVTGIATLSGGARSTRYTGVSVPDSAATTLIGLTSVITAATFGDCALITTADIGGNVVGGYCIVMYYGNAFQIVAQGGNQITFSVNTNSLQVVQTSGATRTMQGATQWLPRFAA